MSYIWEIKAPEIVPRGRNARRRVRWSVHPAEGSVTWNIISPFELRSGRVDFFIPEDGNDVAVLNLHRHTDSGLLERESSPTRTFPTVSDRSVSFAFAVCIILLH